MYYFLFKLRFLIRYNLNMNKSIQSVARQLKIKEDKVNVVLDLIKDGATVPFIARYRKSLTGNLDEEVIEKINTLYQYDVELSKRKETIIKLMSESGLLTPELQKQIEEATKKNELETIYEPFKIGKKTKASEAIALGLEPLAKKIFNETDPNFNPYAEAAKYINDKVKDVDFAIEQAKLIIAQIISTDLSARKYIKENLYKFASIKTKVKRGGKEKDDGQKFTNYYESSEKVSKIPNHRIMAIWRAEDLKIINVSLDYQDSKMLYDLTEKYFKIKTTGKIIRESLIDALKRLMFPSIEREIRKELFEKANDASIELFAKNLEEMLLAPAVKGKTIIAIDPAFVSGCKVAVLSPNGDVLKIDLIMPTPPRKDIVGSSKTINKLIDEYKVDIIVIGNGTASRETEAFVATVVKERSDDIKFAVVSEVGASVYSASKGAIKEFPNLSVEQRSAITIGRRFQDPLNELVKVDPKAIGVGQYQHDVNQKQLAESLTFKTEKVVNAVGVNANSATEEILTYVSGLTKTTAKNFVEYRREHGNFNNRKDVKKVKGLGPKAFEQSIGFIRIHTSDEFLDKTNIHPESYKLAKKLIKEYKIDVLNIDKKVLNSIDVKKVAIDFDTNEYDIQLIIDSLASPSKDIRSDKDGLILKSDILSFNDLEEGMIMEGTVQNITDFGAFIYIGIKEAALIHISNLSDKFVKHPSDIVSTGQRVDLEILVIDKERKRIQGKLISD